MREVATRPGDAIRLLALSAALLFLVAFPASLPMAAAPCDGADGGLGIVRLAVFAFAVGLVASRWHRVARLNDAAALVRTRPLRRPLLVTSGVAVVAQGIICFVAFRTIFEMLLMPFDLATGDLVHPGLLRLVVGSVLFVVFDLTIAPVGAAILTVIYAALPPGATGVDP